MAKINNKHFINKDKYQQIHLQKQTTAIIDSFHTQNDILNIQDRANFIDTQIIQQATLHTGLKSAGIYNPSSRNIPDTVWANINWQQFSQQINNLHAIANPVLKQAWRKLLISPTFIPQEVTETDFLILRLNTLLKLGLINDAYHLAQSAQLYERVAKSVLVEDPRIKPLSYIALARRDWKRLCHLPRIKTDIYNHKVNILCLLYHGKKNAIQVQLQLLREKFISDKSNNSVLDKNIVSNIDVDDGFILLVNMALLGLTILPNQTKVNINPINQAIAILGNITIYDHYPITVSAQNITDLAIVTYLLLHQNNIKLKNHLSIAEQALNHGIITPDLLQHFQLSIAFTNSERNNISTMISEFYSQRVRALVIQQLNSSEETLDLSDKRDLIEKTLKVADKENSSALMLHMLAPYKFLLGTVSNENFILRRAALAWNLPINIDNTAVSLDYQVNTHAYKLNTILDAWQQPNNILSTSIIEASQDDKYQDIYNNSINLIKTKVSITNPIEILMLLVKQSKIEARQAELIKALLPLANTNTESRFMDSYNQQNIAIEKGLNHALHNVEGYVIALHNVTQFLSSYHDNFFKSSKLDHITKALKTLACYDVDLARHIAAWETANILL